MRSDTSLMVRHKPYGTVGDNCGAAASTASGTIGLMTAGPTSGVSSTNVTHVLYNRIVRRGRMETRPKPTTVPAHMDIRPFTESQSSAVLLTRSTRWSDAQRIESQEPPRTRHRHNTPAGELGRDLAPSDYTAAAWDTPHETAATMDGDEDSLTLHDDTVYDTAYDNVYDVYYDVHEEMDVDYGDGPWPDGIG